MLFQRRLLSVSNRTDNALYGDEVDLSETKEQSQKFDEKKLIFQSVDTDHNVRSVELDF